MVDLTRIMKVLVVLLVYCAGLSRGQDDCYEEDWTSTFGVEGESMSQCKDNVSYVSGLISEGYNAGRGVGLSVITKARCCNVKLPYSQEGLSCYWINWQQLTVRKNVWIECDADGYFIHGLFTHGPNFLYQMPKAQCCQPASHPNRTVGCRNIAVDFTQDGTKACSSNTFLKGFHMADDNSLLGGIRYIDQIKCCAMVQGKVDGGFSDWEEWSNCTYPCNGGTQTRRRECDNPRPMGGGRPCLGLRQQTRECNTDPCPIHGGWSQWSQWGACSKTCGTGTGRQVRNRDCTNPPPSGGGRQCTGIKRQTKSCNPPPCTPVDGAWSVWSQWSTCDKQCGPGKTQRSRTCTNPPKTLGGEDCKGTGSRTKNCKIRDCNFTAWSLWSGCSVTCGPGERIRKRDCAEVFPCQGPKESKKPCNAGPCP